MHPRNYKLLLLITTKKRVCAYPQMSRVEFQIYLFEVPVSNCRVWTCILFRIFKKCNIPMVAMGTVRWLFLPCNCQIRGVRCSRSLLVFLWQFPTGLALAIEKKSRRIEISLYCLARAIESFFTCMTDAGYLPKTRSLNRIDVLIFSISTAIIMHCYAVEREVFRSKYLNVLDWVFGVPPPPSETPRHKSAWFQWASLESFSLS